MLQQEDTAGVVTGREQALPCRMEEREGLLKLMMLLRSFSCSLVIMDTAPRSKVFEKKRLDKTIC